MRSKDMKKLVESVIGKLGEVDSIAAVETNKKPGLSDNKEVIYARIKNLNLAHTTPMQAMALLSELKSLC